MAHTRTWDSSYEADPADSDQASGGAQDIRQVKEDVRERLVYDHSWAGDDNDGYHKKITLVDPLGAKPTQANDETYIYSKDVSATSELFFEDESGNEVQLTQAGAVQAFPTGTKMLFYQSSAPTGWTIDVAVDNRMVIVDKDNGGTTGGSSSATSITVTGSNSTTGAHTHSVSGSTDAAPTVNTDSLGSSTRSVPNHTHNVTGTAASAGNHTHTFTANAYAPLYAATIVATKD